MLAICRTLFFIVIIFTITFIGSQYNNLRISSDLKDLSPDLSKKEIIQDAIDSLSKDIESKFTLVILGKERETVKQAKKDVTEAITQMDNILLSSISSEDIIKILKPHRFHLLSEKMQSQLQNKSIGELSNQAIQNLYRIDSALQLTPFNEDPLGTFDDFINTLNNKLVPNGVDQDKKNNNKKNFFSLATFTIIDGAMNIDQQAELTNKINLLEQTLAGKYKTELLRSGVIFFAADAAVKSERDIKFISTISSITIILLLLIVFRSIFLLLLPILSIGIGIAFALSISHITYNSVHILTIVFGASLIGIIIDYSLHFLYHQKHYSKINTQNDKQKKLLRAMLLSLITSLIGYSALSFSSLDALKKAALFSCCGIFAAWLSVIVIGTATRYEKINTSDTFLTFLLGKINTILRPVASRLSISTWFLSLAAVSIILFLFSPTKSDDPRLFFSPSESLLEQESKVSLYNQDFEPGRYIVITGTTTQEIYNRYDKLIAGLVNFNKTNNKKTNNNPRNYFFSAMHLLPSPDQQKNNYSNQDIIYKPNGVTEAIFTTLGIPKEESLKLYQHYLNQSDNLIKPNELIANTEGLPPVWFKNDKRHLGFVMIKKKLDITTLEQNIKILSIDGVTFINTLALAETSLNEQRKSASLLLTLAYLFIALIVLAYFRRITSIKILLVPSTAIVGTLLCYKFFSIDISLFSIMALFLVLGLGMDYVIFIQEMQDDKNITQNAIFLSSLTTLLSFGLLSLSSIPLAYSFGITLLFGNTLNFLSALLYAQINYRI